MIDYLANDAVFAVGCEILPTTIRVQFLIVNSQKSVPDICELFAEDESSYWVNLPKFKDNQNINVELARSGTV